MVANFLSAPPYAARFSVKQAPRVLFICVCVTALTLLSFWFRPPMLANNLALEAAHSMLEWIDTAAELRQELGIPIDPAIDPALSGLIGAELTDLTTTLGDLRAKQTSLNPQFAALVVLWLQKAGVGEGDTVAVSLTGSFPALNMAVLSACKVMDVKPLIFSSVGSSSFGATIPGFTWLDMEKRLYQQADLQWRTRYVSLGGIVDAQGGIDGTGFDLGEAAIARHGAEYIQEGGPMQVVADVKRRWEIYTAQGLPKAFINVGGSTPSLGWIPEAALLDNGLLTRIPSSNSKQRGLIFLMFEAGVPVIHLINIERLAAAYHLPISPTQLQAEVDFVQAQQNHMVLLFAVLCTWLIVGAWLLHKDKKRVY